MGAGADVSALAAGIVAPTRTSGAVGGPTEPPEVDPVFDSLQPVTLELETRHWLGRRVQKQRKQVTRTSSRIHVQPVGAKHEWLFVRNPLDPRRVSGVLVEHSRRTLVEYDESELRTAGIARGWADVVTLGVDRESLRELTVQGGEQGWNGLRFVRHSRPTGMSGKLQEVWWSDAEALPLRSIQRKPEGLSEQALIGLRFEIDETLLSDPAARFPDYESMDVADYREKHHEHEAAHAGVAAVGHGR